MPPAPTAINSATLSSTKVVAASYANASMVTVPLASVPAGVNRVAVEVDGVQGASVEVRVRLARP